MLVMQKFTWQQCANIGETWGHIKPSELSIHFPEGLECHWAFAEHLLHSMLKTLSCTCVGKKKWLCE